MPTRQPSQDRLPIMLALTLAAMLLAAPFASITTAREPDAKKKPRPVPPAFRPIKDKPGLPRVLLIGDSISIGYTLPVRRQLEGVANVHRPPTNCDSTQVGLADLDQWLGSTHWDVIHFNWGLHDLKYFNAKHQLTNPDQPGAYRITPIDQYEKNLDTLVQRLKKTHAHLIWRNTTPVPPGATGRVEGDAAKYNAAALRVMKKYHVEVEDLYSFVKAHEDLQRKKNVHFTQKGYEALAEQIAQTIRADLPHKK